MSKTGTVRHTHKYFRRKDGRWACAGKEGCTHFLPRNMAPLPAGMNSDCWGCDKEFQLAPYNMQNNEPRCDDCMERLEAIDQMLEDRGMLEEQEDPIIKKYRLAKEKAFAERKKQEPEPDQIEVIEPEEE